MVFIELARVSEIPAPHKFDRSIDIEKISIDRTSSQQFQISSFYAFSLGNNHFSLYVLQKRKITKTKQNIRK
jgi:hypothetical protein